MSSRQAATAADFEHWLTQARRGSGSAMRAIYNSLVGEVSGYVRVKGAADVDVATNEVFYRAFSRLDKFTGSPSGFRSWVFTIANNLLIDEHRKRMRRPQVVASLDPRTHDIAGGDTESEAMARLAADDMASMLSDLTESQQDVMKLRIVAGLTLKETADVLDRPVGAVKSLQHRAVEVLRSKLAARVTIPGDGTL